MDDKQALIELYKDSAQENKNHAKRWFFVAVFSNIMWALVIASMVISFFVWDSQFEYVTETTNETEVSQETSGDGNNVYQAGEHATYNEGGE